MTEQEITLQIAKNKRTSSLLLNASALGVGLDHVRGRVHINCEKNVENGKNTKNTRETHT
jgi:hypothetical protein